MSVHLPACAAVSVRIVPLPRLFVPPLLILDNRDIRIGVGAVGCRFAEDEKILRHTDTHLGAVLTLLRPSEAVGLIVLSDHIGYDSFHTHVGKSVSGVMGYAIAVEWINRLTPHTAKAHRHYAVFDMDYGHAARLEYSEQIGGEEIHLLEKLLITLRVAEVRIIWRILVLCRKWNRGYDEANGIVRVEFGVLQFQNIVIVGYAVAVTYNLYTINSHFAGEVRRHLFVGESVFLYDFCHVVNEFVMVLPLGFKSLADSALCLGIDEVNPYDFRLKESLQAVD